MREILAVPGARAGILKPMGEDERTLLHYVAERSRDDYEELPDVLDAVLEVAESACARSSCSRSQVQQLYNFWLYQCTEYFRGTRFHELRVKRPPSSGWTSLRCGPP